jgi:hypothetical protein
LVFILGARRVQILTVPGREHFDMC